MKLRIALVFLLLFPVQAQASERLEVLKMCISLVNDYASAGLQFVDTSTPGARKRKENLANLQISVGANRQILDIVAGQEYYAALLDVDNLLEEFLGGISLADLDSDVISCRTPDRNYDCKPYFAALIASSNVLKSACAADYNEWKID